MLVFIQARAHGHPQGTRTLSSSGKEIKCRRPLYLLQCECTESFQALHVITSIVFTASFLESSTEMGCIACLLSVQSAWINSCCPFLFSGLDHELPEGSSAEAIVGTNHKSINYCYNKVEIL